MQTSPDANAVYAKIDSLDMSPAMKEAMRFVHDHFTRMRFGLPEYDVKGWAVMKVFSLWAALFTMLYYLCKGMWRKALSLLGLCLAASAFLVGLEEGFGAAMHPAVYHLPGSLAATIAGLSARVDLYRSRVLGQTFWW